ncbi:P-loop NTPase fold protein [Staphylococcus epidermidis]
MFIILEDFEIKNKKDDELNLDKDVKKFIDKYINSNYKGTILLNGRWGIGKSSFINLIRENYSLNFNRTRKFIALDYWNKLNAENFYSYLYYQIRPKTFWCIKFSPLLFVIILAIFQWIVTLFKDVSMFNTFNFLMGLFAILIGSVLTFIKDHFSIEKIFECLCKSFIKRNKPIFVIDDFDRIDRESKQILYNNISTINMFENSLIIVLGDYEKIILENDDIFVQKILNNIQYMPDKTDSFNVWNFVNNEIEKIVPIEKYSSDNTLIMNRVSEIFINEKRTFREAKQLLNLFKYHYEEKSNTNINFSELLAISYIYQFHQIEYNFIKENLDIIYSNDLELDETYLKRDDKILIQNVFKNNQLKSDYKFTSFVYNVFHNNNYTKFNYPSISKQINFVIYKIESNQTSIITNEFVHNFLISDIDKSIQIVNENNDELERFYHFLSDSYLDQNVVKDKKLYTNLMEKMAYLSENEYNDKFRYADSLIYKLITNLRMKFEIEPENQYSDIIMVSENIDVSQKLDLLPKFVPARSDKLQGQQKKLVVETIKFNLIDIKNCSKPNIVFYFYTNYYEYISKYINIDRDLFEIFKFNNEALADYINKNFVRISLGSNGKKREIRLYEICFNDKFKEKFISKIDELKNMNIIDEDIILSTKKFSLSEYM